MKKKVMLNITSVKVTHIIKTASINNKKLLFFNKLIKKLNYDYEYDNKINVCLFFHVFHELIE